MQELNPIEQKIQRQFEDIQNIIFKHEESENPKHINEYKKDYKIFIEKFDKVVIACNNRWIRDIVKSYFDDYIIFLRQIRKYNLCWMYMGELKALYTVHNTLNLALRMKVMQLGTSDMDDMTEADCVELAKLNTDYCQNIHKISKRFKLLKDAFESDSKFENSLYFHANNKDVDLDIQYVNKLIVKSSKECDIYIDSLNRIENDIINSHNINIINTYNIHIKKYRALTKKIKEFHSFISRINYVADKYSNIIKMEFHKLHDNYLVDTAEYEKLRLIDTELNLYKHLVNNGNELMAKEYIFTIKGFVTIKSQIDKLTMLFTL